MRLDPDIVPWMKALLSLLASAAAFAVAPVGAHAADRTVLSAGHVDAIAPTLRDGGIALRVLDGTGGGTPVARDAGDVLLHVKPQARLVVPEGLPPSFAFLGAPGSDVWILPQLQDPDLLWAGWSSESIASGLFRDDRLEWTLNRVDGPGPVQLYDTSGIGEPQLFFDSADGLPDTEPRQVGTHAHFNWVFHDLGVYTLNFSVGGERTDGTSTQAYAEYRVFVGELADLPPELVYVDGLEEAYDVGATVTLEAEQSPASRFTGFRWFERCAGDGEPRQVATGARHTFTAARSHDGCRLAVALHDDGGRELVRSAEGLINIRSGTWGPRVIMSRGHADVLRVELSGGRLDVAIKDDSGGDPVIRRPAEVLLHAKPQAAFPLTEDLPPEFGFLGRPGDTIYLLPEVQQEELLWPGWDTAGVRPGALAGDELTWRLLSVDGPGSLQLFTSDLFGLPRIIFNSADGLPDTSSMPASTHVHANWAFSRPGLYRLRFDLSGTPAAGGAPVESGPVEYWFYVGDLAQLPSYPETAPELTPTPTPVPVITPAATPAPTATPTPTAPPRLTPARPTVRLTSASLRGRRLTLKTRFVTRSTVRVTVKRGKRTVARAKARVVGASRRTVRVQLDRRLKPGRYRVHVSAQASGVTVTRTVALRVRR